MARMLSVYLRKCVIVIEFCFQVCTVCHCFPGYLRRYTCLQALMSCAFALVCFTSYLQFCNHIIHVWIFELSIQISICWHLKNRHAQGKQPQYSWNCSLGRNFKLTIALCLSLAIWNRSKPNVLFTWAYDSWAITLLSAAVDSQQ